MPPNAHTLHRVNVQNTEMQPKVASEAARWVVRSLVAPGAMVSRRVTIVRQAHHLFALLWGGFQTCFPINKPIFYEHFLKLSYTLS